MIKELEIHLNTYDTVTVDWKNVICLKMTDVNKSYQFAGDFILEQTVANNVVLDILKRGNLPHKDFETGKETTVFKRLIDCRDIVSLTIVYDDGKEVTYHGPYDENERLISNLATVRKNGKEVVYYVSYDEFEHGFDNKLQTTELDDNRNLVIKIGDFNE